MKNLNIYTDFEPECRVLQKNATTDRKSVV